MAKRWNKVARGICAVAGSGLLLQAGTCAIDPTQAALGLTTAIAQNFLTSIVFSFFGIPFSGGF